MSDTREDDVTDTGLPKYKVYVNDSLTYGTNDVDGLLDATEDIISDLLFSESDYLCETEIVDYVNILIVGRPKNNATSHYQLLHVVEISL